jgi:hypothetical protein
MTISNSLHPAHSRKTMDGLSRIILAAIPFLVFLAIAGQASAANRTPIPRDQASDGILLCKAGGGEVVRTPSVVACCNEQRDGSTICIGCAPDGTRCAKYAVRKGNKTSLRRSLMDLSPSSGIVTAPKTSNPTNNTRKSPNRNKLNN